MNADFVTIGTAKLAGSAPDIVYRRFGANRGPFKGIPYQTEPVIETGFDSNLLSGKATIELTSSTPEPSNLISSGTSYQSLLRLNRQINDELKSHVSLPAHRQTKLFVSYPHGLHILQTTSPELLRQSRSVHICGSFHSQRCTPSRSAPGNGARDPSKAEARERLQGDVIPDSTAQLSKLVNDMLGPNPRQRIEKLELRIYYPGDSYSAVWSDDDSPIVVALRNIARGKIDMVVQRGRFGNGECYLLRVLLLEILTMRL